MPPTESGMEPEKELSFKYLESQKKSKKSKHFLHQRTIIKGRNSATQTIF